MARRFAAVSARVAAAAGSYRTFALALAVVLVWAVSGPLFGFSDTWQLVINTGTTIVTFLMVFVIQNTQNRDALAMHLKLDELIRAIADADDELLDAEDADDEELAELKRRYVRLRLERLNGRSRSTASVAGRAMLAGMAAVSPPRTDEAHLANGVEPRLRLRTWLHEAGAVDSTIDVRLLRAQAIDRFGDTIESDVIERELRTFLEKSARAPSRPLDG